MVRFPVLLNIFALFLNLMLIILMPIMCLFQSKTESSSEKQNYQHNVTRFASLVLDGMWYNADRTQLPLEIILTPNRMVWQSTRALMGDVVVCGRNIRGRVKELGLRC